MNPRFLIYCRAHGKTPKQMLAFDVARYPGGKMCGFILWISSNRRRYKVAHPENFIGDMIHHQEPWTQWLEQNN